MRKKKLFQALQLKDSFLFVAVMEDPELCRKVLERILGFPIKKVVVHTENSVMINLDYRCVRLDVYADDEAGTVYDVEMQTTNKGNLPKRSRSYQGQMDVANLEPGADFNSLPRSFAIIICTFGPFGRGRYWYTFSERCEEDGEPLGDGTYKIFLNTKGKNEDEVPRELVDFLHYVEGSDGFTQETEDDRIRGLQDRITQIKQNRRMEERYVLFREMLDDEMSVGRGGKRASARCWLWS